jgi:two-component system, sensor histidine kinase and response regulator
LYPFQHSQNIKMSTYAILVVDDIPDNFDVIEALLEGLGYTLYYASCGQEALASLDKYDPDLILLDLMMPGMDGLEVCQRIKTMPQWQAVPIMMVTALSGKENLSRCLAAGADDFICKPIEVIELHARVKSMLRIKKQHDRIQSLSKLQRNNIHSLENSLNELRLDLDAGFPDELKLTLNTIEKNISLLERPLNTINIAEFDRVLKSISTSVLKLDELHKLFLFYLQLTLSAKAQQEDSMFISKYLIKEIAFNIASQVDRAAQLVFDIEDAEINVKIEHFKYIITQLLDNAVNLSKPEDPIYIHGLIIDDAFNFWIDDRPIDNTDRHNSKLSELIRFNSGSEEQELSLNLKIIKKIIEIYDGLFLIANTALDRTTIYITLPLAKSFSLQNLPITINSIPSK